MRAIIFLLALLCSTSYSKNIALLIETATGGAINSDKDIITMKRLLGNRYEIRVLHEIEATSDRVRRELNRVALELGENDTFLFYYSGHGGRFLRGDSSEEDAHDDFLATGDVKCNGNSIVGVLVDDELNYLYAQIKAKKIVIIDACHSQTMYKGLTDGDSSKAFKGCGTIYGVLRRGFEIDKKFQSVNADNILYLGASKENESADGSMEGGIFTLAMAKVLEEQGNISFGKFIEEVRKNIKPIATRLGAMGAFTPSISQNGLDKKSVFTGDIFELSKARPKKQNSLKEQLDSHLGGINLKVHGDKTNFSYLERVILKAKIEDTYAHIYLIEMLDKNHYKILKEGDSYECIPIPNRNQRVCQFKDLIGSAPFGETTIYMVVSSKPFEFRQSKGIAIFNGGTIGRKIRKKRFKVGRVSFGVYGR